MSSNRKKLIESMRNHQGYLCARHKNSHVCLFLPIPKTSFFTFSSNSLIASRNSKKLENDSFGVNKPDILRPRSSKLMKEEYANTSMAYGQKNTMSFFARVMTSSNRVESNFARVFPYVDVFFVETIL